MAAEIVMPKVDMVMEDGTFIEWLKQEGDSVTKGEPLFIIGTDKADIEVEAPASGQLVNLGAKRNDVVPVSTIIGYIVQPGETFASKSPASIPSTSPLHPTAVTPTLPQSDVACDANARGQQPIRSTPLARGQARELGLNLAEIPGSGARGRVHKADIERYRAALEAEASQDRVEPPLTEQVPQVDQVMVPQNGVPLFSAKWPAPDPSLHARKRCSGVRLSPNVWR